MKKKSFKKRVIAAAAGIDNGDPLKDFLDDDEIERAIKLLAAVYLMSDEQPPETNESVQRFLKDGETVEQCLMRNRRNLDTLLELLAKEREQRATQEPPHHLPEDPGFDAFYGLGG